METAQSPAIFAISYDPVPVLADFASRYGIAYDLLSDEGSRVISELGLLNRHVEAQQAFYGKGVSDIHRGIPYPGTFILNRDGTVAAKEFEQSYRHRPSGSYLLDRLGVRPPTATDAQSRQSAEGVTVTAWVDNPVYRPLQSFVVRVKLELEEGLHIYVPPVPQGFTPLSVEVVGDEMVHGGSADLPPGRPHSVTGLDERFHVVDGQVDLTAPVRLAGSAFELDGRQRNERRPAGDASISVVVRYQACTSTECFPPQAVDLKVDVVEEDLLRPEG